MDNRGKKIGKIRIFLILGLAIGLVSHGESLAQKLPVFKLSEPKVDRGRANGILNKLHKGKPPEMKARDRADAVVQRAGKKEVEIGKKSGAIFMRDVEKLWNPKAAKGELPDKSNARGIADKFLADNKLLPKAGPHHKVSFDGFSETAFSNFNPKGGTSKGKTVIDIQTNYKVDVSVKGPEGKTKMFPVVGGGGKFKVAVGHRGSVVGYHGVWREIAEVAGMEKILSRDQAIVEFKNIFGKGHKLSKTSAFLAYYQGGFGKGQSVMAPVWVVKAEVNIGGNAVPVRNTIIAATKYGPHRGKVAPPKARKKDAQPLQRSLDQDEKGQQSMLDHLIPPAYANPAYECGTSWHAGECGVPGCMWVGNGFVHTLKGAGWQVNFNWGGYAAFESDWNRNDDYWVDAADFVMYCGHANMNGWTFHKPDDTFLHYNDVGGSLDRYGKNDAEWIAIAACGPLQDQHFVSGGGNAFTRWRPIFDGLHILLGYGAVTFDNKLEGSRLAQLCLAGWPIINAWFRTAWEIQPSWNGYSAPNGPRIYVAAMYAHNNNNHATRWDRIWGKGFVAPDPIPPVWLTLMWMGT